jgi:O-acetyl-ADP-ribose deacetylase (regulator of RNase III)
MQESLKINNSGKLELITGDITHESTDAIANAANTKLKGGGGVDGAIHRAGGPEIMAECRKIGSCPTGEAVITCAGRLKAKYVIHTAGPVYNGGNRGEAKKLASCYKNCLKLAVDNNVKSIAFPSISTGIYGYPLDEAAPIALGTVINFLKENASLELVKFVLFDEKTFNSYSSTLKKFKEL